MPHTNRGDKDHHIHYYLRVVWVDWCLGTIGATQNQPWRLEVAIGA